MKSQMHWDVPAHTGRMQMDFMMSNIIRQLMIWLWLGQQYIRKKHFGRSHSHWHIRFHRPIWWMRWERSIRSIRCSGHRMQIIMSIAKVERPVIQIRQERPWWRWQITESCSWLQWCYMISGQMRIRIPEPSLIMDLIISRKWCWKIWKKQTEYGHIKMRKMLM